MRSSRTAILLVVMICSCSFEFGNALPDQQVSRRDTKSTERFLINDILPLRDILSALFSPLKLLPLVDILQPLGVTGVLASTTDLILNLPEFVSLLAVNPGKAFTLLFDSGENIATELEQLTVGRLTCTGCLFLVVVIKSLQALQFSDDQLATAVTQICIDFKVQTPKVCTGLIERYKTMLLFSLKHTNYNAVEVCGFLVGYGCGVEPDQSKWKIMLPGNKPPVTPVVLPEPGGAILTVLHLTDPHVDFNYTDGTPTDCAEPMCCHTDSTPGDTNMVGGTYGGQLYCDIPLSTLKLLFAHAKEQYPNPDFILWTGDQPPHDVWYETMEGHMEYNAVVDGLLEEFFPGVPVFPAIGNHDAAPSNNFPVNSSIIPVEYQVGWLYNHTATLWSQWLPEEALKTVRKGGYYSVATSFPGLRVISINNNLCYFADFWLLINATDPLGQQAWLIKELQAAEVNNEKVIILLHVPPGSDDCLRVWSSNYYDIVNRFESTIVGQFSGHTHVDNFMVFYDRQSGRPTNVVYVCPSATSFENYNLAYRTIFMDKTPHGSYALLDMLTFMMDLQGSNANSEPIVELLYSFKEAYDIPSMQPADLNNVITKIETVDENWQRFYTYYSRNSSVHPQCDASCKKAMICQLRSARSRDESQCPDVIL